MQKLTLEYIKQQAALKGFSCVSNQYIDSKTKLLFICPLGHEFNIIYNSFQRGQGCSKCRYTISSNKRKHTIEYVKEFIKSKGFECLSDVYQNSHSILNIKCSKNHIFNRNFSDFTQNRYCPTCNNYSYVKENVVRSFFEAIFKEKFPNTRPDWLVNPDTGKRFELDGFCENLLIGFENHGEQHYSYKNNYFINSQEELEKRQYFDKLKQDICIKNNVKLFIIKYDVPISELINEIKQQAISLGLDILKYNFDISTDLIDVSIPDKVQEIKNLAKQKGINFLSENYLGSHALYNFQCVKCNYQWKTSISCFIKTKLGCKKCCKNHKGNRYPYTLNDLIEFAKNKNGKILSKKYIGKITKYIWVCEFKHTWEASALSVMNNGTWCKTCYLNSKR